MALPDVLAQHSAVDNCTCDPVQVTAYRRAKHRAAALTRKQEQQEATAVRQALADEKVAAADFSVPQLITCSAMRVKLSLRPSWSPEAFAATVQTARWMTCWIQPLFWHNPAAYVGAQVAARVRVLDEKASMQLALEENEQRVRCIAEQAVHSACHNGSLHMHHQGVHTGRLSSLIMAAAV
jgi:hypothetical protein